MHPSLTEALARERHAELLHRQRFRESATDLPGPVARRARSPIPSIRHSLGSALVVAGTRLIEVSYLNTSPVVAAAMAAALARR